MTQKFLNKANLSLSFAPLSAKAVLLLTRRNSLTDVILTRGTKMNSKT